MLSAGAPSECHVASISAAEREGKLLGPVGVTEKESILVEKRGSHKRGKLNVWGCFFSKCPLLKLCLRIV